MDRAREARCQPPSPGATLGAMSETIFGTPGKYDDDAKRVLVETDASVVVLIVIDGKRGQGFSCCGNPARPEAVATIMGGNKLAQLLRRMADMLDAGAPPAGVVRQKR